MTEGLQHLFPHLLPPLASLLISASLIFLAARFADVKREFRLLAVCCVAVFLGNLSHLCLALFPGSWTAAFMFETARPVSLLILPVVIHIVHGYLDIRGREAVHWIAYALAFLICLLYTSDAADDLLCVALGGRRILKTKNYFRNKMIPNYWMKMLQLTNQTTEYLI